MILRRATETFFVEAKSMLTGERVKTPIACDLIPATYTQLANMLRCKKIKAPPKDTSGDYLWGQEDIEAARRVLAARRPGRSAPAAVPTEGLAHAS
jgi:hypothetical protein